MSKSNKKEGEREREATKSWLRVANCNLQNDGLSKKMFAQSYQSEKSCIKKVAVVLDIYHYYSYLCHNQ